MITEEIKPGDKVAYWQTPWAEVTVTRVVTDDTGRTWLYTDIHATQGLPASEMVLGEPIDYVWPAKKLTVEAWEAAWAEYVDALDEYEADWSGETFPISIHRVGVRLADAKRCLRSLDPVFCNRLKI